MMEVAGKRIMVIGLGITGRSLAHFLHKRGATLVMTDRRLDLDPGELPEGEVHTGVENPDWLAEVDFVVVSPGVARTSPLLQAARARGKPVLGEIELASGFLRPPMVAVTGTNGKSTVTTLIGEILRAAGLQPFIGGNLGTPLIEAVSGEHQVIVAEISSFQLEWIRSFRPFIAIHLNLSEDHFDRYADLDDYGRTKARVFENQTACDWAILNRDDPHVWKLRNQIQSRVVGFGSAASREQPAAWIEGNVIRVRIVERDETLKFSAPGLPGRHNAANAAAAAAAAVILGIPARLIEESLSNFKGLAHRLEFVRELEGVRFVDDSKGTNVGAVVEAIAATRMPIVLIAGGLDKGGDYAPLFEPIRKKVRQVILYGAARNQIRAALSGAAPVELVATLKEAVERAASLASRGDTVLLSPACSSFDQFRDYAERGRIFKELVWSL